MPLQHLLPAGTHFFERGWLSSNNILLLGPEHSALVDSGYVLHEQQTLALVESHLGGRPLDLLINTHLHSDHCGGNTLLQRRYRELRTLIPAGSAQAVATWDQDILTYKATGQRCERFTFTGTLEAGSTISMGASTWQVHAAPGHDLDSVVLFEPESRTLISADALWENGFGVVFPELEGIDAFDAVSASIDLCEDLQPKLVIPGHGPIFTDVNAAIARARSRLNYLRAGEPPINHSLYAAKVLLKFFLLERQRVTQEEAVDWLTNMPYFKLLECSLATHLRGSNVALGDTPSTGVATWLVSALCKSGAAKVDGNDVVNV